MRVPTRYLPAILLPCVFGGAVAACDNPQQLLSRPQPETVNPCLVSISHDLGRGNAIDRDFVFRFIEVLLPGSADTRGRTAALRQFDIDYIEIAGIISLLQSEKLVEAYIDFIVDSADSADELRTYGLGRLYTLQAPTVVGALERRSEEQQQTVIGSLAWGLANNFYPHIHQGNYRRLIVGEHWEQLDGDHRSQVQLRIEAAVLELLDAI